MWLITRAMGVGFGLACAWLISAALSIDITSAAVVYLLIWVGLYDGRVIHAAIRARGEA